MKAPRVDQLKVAHFRLLAKLAETGQISRAAAEIGISQPSASRMLVDVEAIVGHPVRERSGRGVLLTPLGAALAARGRRIQLEIEDAATDIREIASGGSGNVRIGSVTAPSVELVLPALRSLRLTDPGITVDVLVAPSALLCQELAAGRLDFALGRVADPAEHDSIDLLPLGSEPVALVVRRGHPLDGPGPVLLKDLQRFDWILPGADSPLGGAVLRGVAALGYPLPRQQLTTASFLLTLTVIQQSNAIAPLSRPIAEAFTTPKDAPFVCIETTLDIDVGPYGAMTRKGQSLTPVVAKVLDRIVQTGRAGL